MSCSPICPIWFTGCHTHAATPTQVAIASSVNLRTTLTVTPGNVGEVMLSLPDIGLTATWQLRHLQEVHIAGENVTPLPLWAGWMR